VNPSSLAFTGGVTPGKLTCFEFSKALAGNTPAEPTFPTTSGFAVSPFAALTFAPSSRGTLPPAVVGFASSIRISNSGCSTRRDLFVSIRGVSLDDFPAGVAGPGRFVAG
jgi:hypothetical protein